MRAACAESCSSCMSGEMEKPGVSNLRDFAAEGRQPVLKCFFFRSLAMRRTRAPPVTCRFVLAVSRTCREDRVPSKHDILRAGFSH
jgi:hypothetical protein